MCRMIACGRDTRCVTRTRYGIEATRMPWVASSNALRGQPAASEQTEAIDGLERIVGTGRMESACGTEKRAHGPLVDSNQERGNVAHYAFYCSILRRTPRVPFFSETPRAPRSAVKFACHALPQRAQA